MEWFNTQLPHSSLEWLTPDEKYLATWPKLEVAAQDQVGCSPRVTHLVSRFIAIDHSGGGQLGIVCTLTEVQLNLEECFSNNWGCFWRRLR